MADAVVVGAGHNGLVAANMLADAGWDVEVLEAQPEPGGAVRSDRGVHPDFVSDLCSAFYPLGVASPALRDLDLERHGLRWRHAPAVLAHPLPDGSCAVLERDRDATAAGLDALGAGDGEAWLRLCRMWDAMGEELVRALLGPFPPVRAAVPLAVSARRAGGLRVARALLAPVRTLGEGEFDHPAGPLLIAGSALHTDMFPETTAGSVFGWLLSMVGQVHGWPVPEGGAGALTAALVRRLESRGGRVRCGVPVTSVVVRDGRALGVRTADGEAVRAVRAVLADVSAPALYGGLVGWDDLPGALREDMRRFHWDHATFKVDWALSGPIPWSSPEAARAGTVHLSPGLDAMTGYSAELATGHLPSEPFTLLGQMTTADPTRSPAGTESVWAYTHIPQRVKGDAGPDGITGAWDERDRDAMAARLENTIERLAPGFRSRILNRRVTAPPDFREHNASLPNGALNGGTAMLHQQFVFRPVPGLGRPETPIARLYLASASAHPGGGVHGACGANAARAALAHASPAGRLLTPALKALARLLAP
ncbi:phytoene dehydrogenase-like protein [Actinomadura pelletieri DSM 43383]|uniref:Pyridine nucleotide-disulfide oxidoreductase domain-containing protein 2 n=1 Tax=Actinomadura pelletieri DSM 43383 TaxID=1120940 RepID=A0A495QL85_9ACTN|nr:NAD(P)/FAD-dependent oxidoreductase [Actinomadura pelletieri]RKS73340.1 phytoene dehydrogenase-like protein [Actinomadura pelletieri DSM 43383]